MGKAQTINGPLVDEHVSRLKSAGTSERAFNAAFEAFRSDERLSNADVIAIAQKYAEVGRRFTTRKSSFEGVHKRFIDLARIETRLKAARNERVL
jgi:hypothetical protein